MGKNGRFPTFGTKLRNSLKTNDLQGLETKRDKTETKFKPPALYDAGGDVLKRWFVYYSIWDAETQKFRRVKVYEDINATQDPAERRTRADAIIYVINELLESEAENAETPGAGTTIRAVFERALAIHLPNLRKRSGEQYRLEVNRLVEFLSQTGRAGLDVAELNKTLVYAFADWLSSERKLGAKSRNAALTNLSTLARLLVEREILESNPFANVERLRETEESTQPFTLDEAAKLKAHLAENDPDLLLFVSIIYYCFIRPVELLRLPVRVFDLNAGRVFVPGAVSKNRKGAYVTLPDPLVETLRARTWTLYEPTPNAREKAAELRTATWAELPGDWFLFGKNLRVCPAEYIRNRVSERHRKRCDEIGLPKALTLYSWKPTGVIAAVKAGLNIKEIQTQLRHASLDQVNEYLRKYGVGGSDELKNKFPEF